MKCGAEAGLAGKSQWEERISDAALTKGRTAMALLGSEMGCVFERF